MSSFTETRWALRQEALFLCGTTMTLGENQYTAPLMHVLSEHTLLFSSKELAEEHLKRQNYGGNEQFEFVEIRRTLTDHWWPDSPYTHRKVLSFHPEWKTPHEVIEKRVCHLFRGSYLLVFGVVPNTRISLTMENRLIVDNAPAKLYELLRDNKKIDEWADLYLPDRCLIDAPTLGIEDRVALSIEGGIEAAALIGLEYYPQESLR